MAQEINCSGDTSRSAFQQQLDSICGKTEVIIKGSITPDRIISISNQD